MLLFLLLLVALICCCVAYLLDINHPKKFLRAAAERICINTPLQGILIIKSNKEE
jgi:hypothetical protein